MPSNSVSTRSGSPSTTSTPTRAGCPPPSSSSATSPHRPAVSGWGPAWSPFRWRTSSSRRGRDRYRPALRRSARARPRLGVDPGVLRSLRRRPVRPHPGVRGGHTAAPDSPRRQGSDPPREPPLPGGTQPARPCGRRPSRPSAASGPSIQATTPQCARWNSSPGRSPRRSAGRKHLAQRKQAATPRPPLESHDRMASEIGY